MEAWIVTFDRPHALNRLIETLGKQGIKSNILSNHPKLQLLESNRQYVASAIVNSLNTEKSNSWCARSWNTLFMRAFANQSEGIFIQDDTNVDDEFVDWLTNWKSSYDFIWGPAGDQFFYMKKNIFVNTGWWDERYIGCYCGDADYLKRVWMNNPHDSLSISDTHNWGFHHNSTMVSRYVNTEQYSKNIGGYYENQHWQIEKMLTGKPNSVILQSQKHFRDKWGIDLDNGRPVIESMNRKQSEIDWYPWFTVEHGVKI